MIQPNPEVPAPELLSIRNEDKENHHLWNNHGTWWLHYTLHFPDYTRRRIRRSLGTTELDEARRRRDAILGSLPRAR